MLELIKSNKMESVRQIRALYPDCKVLVYEADTRMNPVIYAKVYAVSRDGSSLSELCTLRNQLREQGLNPMIVGSYNTGGFVGVQYFKRER